MEMWQCGNTDTVDALNVRERDSFTYCISEVGNSKCEPDVNTD